MKKLVPLSAIFILLSALIQAMALNVKDIPNVQLQNRARHISNPDGIISENTQWRIDTLISGIRERTSAEIAVVVVNSLDGEDPDLFATELFEEWGVGKSDKGNGLLMLVSLNDRSVTMRTGYGLEGVLPDIYLKHLVEDSLYPRMRAGNYDLGVESTLLGVSEALNDPEAVKEIISQQKELMLRQEKETFEDLLHTVAVWMSVITLIYIILYIYARIKSNNKPKDIAYKSAQKLTFASLIGTFIGLGLPVIVFLLARSWKNKIRYKAPIGSSGQKMELIPIPKSLNYISPTAVTESRIKSMEYDVWLDPATDVTTIYGYPGQMYMSFSKCNVCGARAVQEQGTFITRKATTMHSGEQLTNFVCLHCGNLTQRRTTLPKIVPIIIPGSGGGGGGGFSGGSFGGGHTGGGGFSGKW